MTDRPILFSGPMVRAILEGRKIQTRRIITPKNEPARMLFFDDWTDCYILDPGNADWRRAAHGYSVGDRLWVRETFGYGCRPDPGQGAVDGVEYRADEAYLDEHDDLPLHTPQIPDDFCYGDVMGTGWRPSIHMPRWASRLTLHVTDVRVERLQEITCDDAVAEGMDGHPANDAVCDFSELWDSLNAKRGFGWDANPWVVALTFSVEHANIYALQSRKGTDHEGE